MTEKPTDPNTLPLLEVENLRLSFYVEKAWQEVIHGISFKLEKGRTLGLVGESGSGKSVSSLALMRLLDKRNSRVEADSILFNQMALLDFSEKKQIQKKLRGKKMAMIFQEPMTSLNPVFRCGKQVAEALILHEKLTKKASTRAGDSAFSSGEVAASGSHLSRLSA